VIAMAIETVKQKILHAVEQLPDTATLEDAIERLCFLAKVEEGLRQSDAGETVPHAEAILLISR
jgi:predicted transcriptional regulator